MKKILEDLKAEGFSMEEMVVYGFLYPLGMMVVLVAAGAIGESRCGAAAYTTERTRRRGEALKGSEQNRDGRKNRTGTEGTDRRTGRTKERKRIKQQTIKISRLWKLKELLPRCAL